MSLLLLGMNHRTASVETRERVAFSREEALEALRRLREERGVSQALLISTCNRTELYAHATDREGLLDQLRQDFFYRRLEADANGVGQDMVYRLQGDRAVEHLFRVACGLDSMVLGEQQILGQVKSAYEISREARVAGAVLHRLAARAFRIGKRVRTETRIGTGAVSVAFAAVELASKVFQDLEHRGVLLVGAGENGKLLAQHLLARRVKPLLIASRTLERAEGLARELGGETLTMDGLVDAMSRVDIVVSTTGSTEPVIHRDMVKQAMSRRGNRLLVFIDVAVPRDVAPDVDELGSVMRFDMDAIHSIVDQNLARRAAEIPKVEKLVRKETETFMRWMGNLDAGPTIRELHQSFEEIRQAELAKHARRFKPEDREHLDVFTRNLIRKVLMDVTREIKGYHLDVPEEAERLATLRRLFHLREPDLDGEEDLD